MKKLLTEGLVFCVPIELSWLAGNLLSAFNKGELFSASFKGNDCAEGAGGESVVSLAEAKLDEDEDEV